MYIWVIMRDQSNKNKYFFAMSPFKVVYLCTFLSIFRSLLWTCSTSGCTVWKLPIFSHKQHLSVNLDNTVGEKTNRDWTVKGNPGKEEMKRKKHVKNIASHGHVTTQRWMCQLLKTLEEYKNVLFHADKSNNLSALVFFFLKHKALGAFQGRWM